MSDTAFPNNGGWVFRQAATGWTNPAAMIGKKASVDSILKHRLANPAITAKHQLSTDPEQIERELVQYQQLRGALPTPAVPLPSTSFFRSSSSLPARVVEVAADIKRAAQGAAVLVDWISSGGQPVEQVLADKRAAICAICPKNVEGSWYTVAPATLIKETLEARKDLKLETSSDAQLKSCDVCKCLMRLKVWVPLHYIAAHTKPEIMAEFPQNCWIFKRDQ